ncbi:hypothetical protein CcCBS67573_g07619 [Chytriomyces confervae]|uniref:40S ribosomal protein S18 n=1 Tax=Chytriomyces confervae TaxID=246404 RepID=A0A507EUL7_9FUNG|nr:hypothetical protein CcCBS67573_g07619 [Chytriomyces confervae]
MSRTYHASTATCSNTLRTLTQVAYALHRRQSDRTLISNQAQADCVLTESLRMQLVLEELSKGKGAWTNEELVFGVKLSQSIKSQPSVVVPDKNQFQHILRLLNTNVEGKRKIMYSLTAIKGVGRRFSNLVCKKADIDLNKRAGELTNDELERIVNIMQAPSQYKIPNWFLNRQKDPKDGKNTHSLSNAVDNKLREDLERLKKIRAHRGLRHYWGIRVRGQHTKTTGRRGKSVGVAKKK